MSDKESDITAEELTYRGSCALRVTQVIAQKQSIFELTLGKRAKDRTMTSLGLGERIFNEA
jgi:hypothetical protein